MIFPHLYLCVFWLWVSFLCHVLNWHCYLRTHIYGIPYNIALDQGTRFFDKGGKWSWNSLVLLPTHISLNLEVAGLMELWDSLSKGQWSIALPNLGTSVKMLNNFQPIATIFLCVCHRTCGSRNRCKVWRGPFHYSRSPSWGNLLPVPSAGLEVLISGGETGHFYRGT